MYRDNEVIVQNTNTNICLYLFSEKKNKFPRTLFEARKVAVSATYKQSKTVWNCVWKVFLLNHKIKENLVGLGSKNQSLKI